METGCEIAEVGAGEAERVISSDGAGVASSCCVSVTEHPLNNSDRQSRMIILFNVIHSFPVIQYDDKILYLFQYFLYLYNYTTVHINWKC